MEDRHWTCHIDRMTQAVIILSGILIAGAILLTNHWQIALGPVKNMPNPQVYRLDRWTGDVVTCSVINPDASPLDSGVRFPCEGAK